MSQGDGIGPNEFRSFQTAEGRPSRIQRTVLPLLLEHGGAFKPIGTGFLVHPSGLLLTAGHVLRHARKVAGFRLDQDVSVLDGHVHCLWLSGDVDEDGKWIGGMIPLLRFYDSPDIDIGAGWLGQLRHADGTPVQHTVVPLDISMPREGEKALAIGYLNMTASDDEPGVAGDRVIALYQDTATSSGEVVELHPQGRDRGMYHFPCYHINASFAPGMSGGPVFNEREGVCGVVSGSMEGSEPNYVSYASMIWAAMGLPIEAPLSRDGKMTRTTLLELARLGHLKVSGPVDRMELVQEEAGRVTVRYRT